MNFTADDVAQPGHDIPADVTRAYGIAAYQSKRPYDPVICY
jgi:hypothetical protein